MRRLGALSMFAVVIAISGCDQINNLSKPAAAPAAPAQQAATPAAAPATAPAAPAAAPAQAAAPDSSAASKDGGNFEAKAHVKQGLAFISNAKNASSPTNFQENLENAINEFSQAILKDPKYAEAYSNRAVAYMQQKKFNKALDDLKKAVELKPGDATIRYNLASLHSLNGNVDLALDEIDAALTRGFDNYDALRKDPDLDNVRRSPEFRKVLEKHKVFITG
jgi:Flp pilus assembly protein TadD